MIFRRRTFLTGLAATLAAPAIVQASSLMKISPQVEYVPLRVSTTGDAILEINGQNVGFRTWGRVLSIPKDARVKMYAGPDVDCDAIIYHADTQTETTLIRTGSYADVLPVQEMIRQERTLEGQREVTLAWKMQLRERSRQHRASLGQFLGSKPLWLVDAPQA